MPSEIFKIGEKEGIGILRLQVIDQKTVHVYEVLKPKEIILCGMSHSSQRSPGVFENSMKEINYLKQMFQRPSKLYDDFIRPQIKDIGRSLKLDKH